MRHIITTFLAEHTVPSLSILTLTSGKHVLLHPIPDPKLPLLVVFPVLTPGLSSTLEIKCYTIIYCSVSSTQHIQNIVCELFIFMSLNIIPGKHIFQLTLKFLKILFLFRNVSSLINTSSSGYLQNN